MHFATLAKTPWHSWNLFLSLPNVRVERHSSVRETDATLSTFFAEAG